MWREWREWREPCTITISSAYDLLHELQRSRCCLFIIIHLGIQEIACVRLPGHNSIGHNSILSSFDLGRLLLRHPRGQTTNFLGTHSLHLQPRCCSLSFSRAATWANKGFYRGVHSSRLRQHQSKLENYPRAICNMCRRQRTASLEAEGKAHAGAARARGDRRGFHPAGRRLEDAPGPARA